MINAEKIHVTGNKLADKMYYRFTGYIGNLKTETLGQALERHPERVIEIAVKGMLPKNTLGREMYRKLKVYEGPITRTPPSSRKSWISDHGNQPRITAPAVASPPPPACSCARAPATSPSTTVRWTSSSAARPRA